MNMSHGSRVRVVMRLNGDTTGDYMGLEDYQNFNPIILKDIADESKDIICA